MSEWMEQVANELPVDAVGIWQIVPAGRRGFGLEGEALTDYLRRQIAVLLSRGAVPVTGGRDEGHEWIVQRQYGSRPDEIVGNVVREWLADGASAEDYRVWIRTAGGCLDAAGLNAEQQTATAFARGDVFQGGRPPSRRAASSPRPPTSPSRIAPANSLLVGFDSAGGVGPEFQEAS